MDKVAPAPIVNAGLPTPLREALSKKLKVSTPISIPDGASILIAPLKSIYPDPLKLPPVKLMPVLVNRKCPVTSTVPALLKESVNSAIPSLRLICPPDILVHTPFITVVFPLLFVITPVALFVIFKFVVHPKTEAFKVPLFVTVAPVLVTQWVACQLMTPLFVRSSSQVELGAPLLEFIIISPSFVTDEKPVIV